MANDRIVHNSGEWSMNMQNLPRGGKLRQALRAPPGHRILAPDLSQIEARIVAVLAQQDDLVTAFAKGIDVYAAFAEIIFGHPVNKKDHSVHRFIGKTGILGLGYGCGVDRFFAMVTAQARGSGIDLKGLFDKEMATNTVYAYRRRYNCIPTVWQELDGHWKHVINGAGETQIDWGPVTIRHHQVILPNGLILRYKGDEGIWGGHLLENITQALARVLIMQTALRLNKRGLRFVMQAHDELLFVVPEHDVEAAKTVIMEEMTRRPAWLPSLPVAAEVTDGATYAQAKG